MIDLTQALTDLVLSGAVESWSEAQVADRLTDFTAALGGQIDWDDAAGEKWAQIEGHDAPLVYLSVHAPLLVLNEELVSDSFSPEGLTIVRVPSMHASVLTCDREVLRQFFGVEDFTSEFDDSRFSFSDLYYQTVT
ncbi:hypothetical protein EV643_10946 [Kribbella sp. VKM Ac-2527]|uniref:Uncharacterized protein n=2 Tax=Kribbella caucasensis TaxID=2512215 RepID=A0A4R6KAR3_9ACTN|nr:hypothetical protein EV643_10946 [Kribbella sp. VKM Ac-2527]